MPSLPPVQISDRGAVVNVLIRPAEEQANALRNAGQAVPESEQTIGFLDPGASHTMLDTGIVLKMKSANGFTSKSVGSPGSTEGKAYLVEIALVDLENELRWIPLRVGAGHVCSSGTNVCLGRDFLEHFVVTFDGPRKLAFVEW